MKCPFLIAIAVVSCCGSLNSAENLAEEDHEDRLMRVMMSQSKFRRPVLSSKDNVTVQFGITLHQIIDVVEKNQILKLSLFTRQKWSNPLLRWNLSDYGGVSEINVDPDYLWKPDIYLYNNADEDKDGAQDRARTNIQVDHNGTNKWFAPVITQSSCKINVQYFPFDEQSCTLKFGSWTYDAWRVDIVAEGESADLNTFQVNGEWSLVSFPCKGNKEVYKCCPQPYSDVTCTLKIRRRTTYFFVNLIVPCFLITVLSLLSFFLPSEAGERITLVITNLLALTVFMLIVADILPPTSEVVPLISIYFTSILIEVGLSLIATCIVLKCYFTNPTTTEVPFWVHCLVFRGISKLVGMKVEKKGRKSRRSKKAADDDKTSHLPASMAESLPSNFNVNSHVTSHRAVDTDGLLSEHSNDPFCKLCHDKNVNLLHVPKELNSRNSSRSPSRTSLKRDSWCESASNENNFNFNLHSQKCLIAALLHQQEHLVNNVNRLVKALEKQEKLEEKREEWFMVAEILDTFFLYVFVIIMIGSTVLIFAVKNLG